MPLLERNIEGIWWSKQTAKGSPAATATKRGRKVAGDANVNRDDGGENYSDGERYSSNLTFVNTIVGNGNPSVQGQPSIIGQLAYLTFGQESVATILAGEIIEHTATPGSGSFWATFWKKVGSTVGPLRQKFNDCRISMLRIEGSSGSKVIKAIPTFFSLDPGEVFVTDPVQGEDTSSVMLFTDAEGLIEINGVVHKGVTSFALEVTDALTPVYGDSVIPFEVAHGQGQVRIEGISLFVDQQGYAFYNTQIYGVPAPPAGAKPINIIPPTGSYVYNAKRGRTQTLDFGGTATGGTYTVTVGGQTTAAIQWNATAAVAATAVGLLSTVGAGNVTGSGGPGPTDINLKFRNANVALATAASSLTGTAPTLAVIDRGATEQVKIELLNIDWTPDMAIAGDPDGGTTELALAATARKVGSTPHCTIVTRSTDIAYT